MKMKLIDGRRDERQKAEELLRKRKATRFLAQVIAHTNRVVAAGRDFDEADEDDLVFILTGAVKFFAFLEGEELDGETDKELRALWQMYDSMIALASCLSPAKIAQLFPPDDLTIRGRIPARISNFALFSTISAGILIEKFVTARSRMASMSVPV